MVLDNIAQTVATFVGISSDELIGAACFDKVRENIWAHKDAFARRARIVRKRSLYAAQDQRMTLSESNEILTMAILVRSRHLLAGMAVDLYKLRQVLPTLINSDASKFKESQVFKYAPL